MTQHLRRGLGMVVLAASLALAGCASLRDDPGSAETYDPLEPMNRAVFRVNLALDRGVIKPVAKGYRKVVPEFVRNRFRAFFNNLLEPRVFVNNILQVRLNSAGMTFTRFLMNTTVGLGGLFDVASNHRLPRQTGEFGQTLYMWEWATGRIWCCRSSVRPTYAMRRDSASICIPPSTSIHSTRWWLTVIIWPWT